MSTFGRLLLVTLFSLCSLVAGAQQKKIKHAPVKATSPASGEEMFISYCAVCHGKDGKGGGPAAEALKVPPADLTVLAQKNSGKFPSNHVTSVLRGEANLPAHGNKEMPVWGAIFWQMSQGHETEVQQRVANLTKYVESLQKK
jgi:mono/diheme cytochrome c family protein